MPPPIVKKPKGREGRQSRSRNTTPSSAAEISTSSIIPANTSYTEIPIGSLQVPSNITYDDLLERHGGAGGIPDPSHLTTMAQHLKHLSDLASARGDACNQGMRVLSEKRKSVLLEEEREKELEREQALRARESEERRTLKREAEDDEDVKERKSGKQKKQRKERSAVRDPERPLNHGAHGLARQDGLDLPLEAMPDRACRGYYFGIAPPEGELDRQNKQVELERKALIEGLRTGTPAASDKRTLRRKSADNKTASPSLVAAQASASPSKRKLDAASGRSSSSLSEASPLGSPSTAPPAERGSNRATPSSSTSSDDAHQPPPAASLTQYQTFGPNPLTFDDPTIYEIREVTDDMTDEEKKEIYCVASFPHDDLKDLIAGTPPNKDFSNAVKPNNQVQYNTFTSYLDNFLRPLKEEDIGFLNERGDRTTPFIMPRRGKRHYAEVWAEEDGTLSRDTPEQDGLPPNQPRGSLDQMDDDTAETDQVSSGPLLNRLLSTMRFEHRVPPEDRVQINGITNGNGEASLTNGDLPNGTSHEPNGTEESSNKPTSLPPATALPSSDRPPSNAPNLSHAQIDDRLKAELRHIGFLAADDEPDYDAHYDDEIAERLRYLQDELRRVSILNGARKARVLDLAQEQMAYQEYATILEDLDSQVQQAYLKRTRTLGKNKKNTKRPGGAGGGSHAVGGGVGGGSSGVGDGGGGVSKPAIGDVARQLMNRRAKWEEKIGPVFRGDIRRVRGKGEGIFTEGVMEPLIRAEKERWEEEAEI